MSAHDHAAAAVAPVPAEAPAKPPAPPAVSAMRLLSTLGLSGALAGLLLVVAYAVTLPAIEANRARAIEAAVKEVLKGPERMETLYVVDRALVKEPPAGVETRGLERVWVGYGRNDERVGFALMASEPGFQDTILMMVGYDPGKRKLLGMKVLETKETPGLGDKIEKEPFTRQFDGVEPLLVGVKGKEGPRTDPHEIRMVTGATISSRTVVRAINKAIERLGPLMQAHAPEGKGR